MCLMVYLASSVNVALSRGADLSVQMVEPERDAIRQWFSYPHVRYIGSHSGCGCGFPSVVADEPVLANESFFKNDEDRVRDLASVCKLLALIDQLLMQTSTVELFPVWAGDESEAAAGIVQVARHELKPETFLLTQHFLYRIKR